MIARVLVADGNAERGREIGAACSARGLTCQVTTHGSAALEAALADVPDVVVCQLALPLIDGPQLDAILRANPRTQEIDVLFVGDHPGDAERRDLGAEVVAPPCDPDALAGRLLDRLAQRGGAAGRLHEDDQDGGVEGQLAQLPLADLLQLFHVSRKTGTVELVRGGGGARRQVGRVLLRGGDVVAASVGSCRGEKALFRLLAWDRGSFSFRSEPSEAEPNLHKPTRALLREGLRQLREWQRLAVDLPPMSASVTLVVPRSALPNVIHPLTQEVLVVLDLYSRVQDVVDHCSYPDYQVLRTLHTLVQRGMVELHREPEAARLARDVHLFSPARTARLREWLELDRPGGGAPRDAKLLLVAADPSATRDFAQLLRRLPGVELEAGVESGGIAADDLLPLGRVAVDPEVGIELIHVPAHERFAPVWPAAAHGALATLLLLSGPVGAAVAAVRGAARALGALPRARVFHLLLLDKGQRVCPDDLHDNLAIVDDGSLFLIPAESPEKAAVLLREMFGRILP
jgi:CheY-like chemotaxis protein